MKKQIISAVMALGMLVSSLPVTMAKTYPSTDSEWEFATRTEGKGSWKITRADSYNGEYSLYVDATDSIGSRLYMKTNTKGSHKISFYAKAIQTGWSSGMRVASGTSWAPDKQMRFVENTANEEGTYWTRTPMKNGWVKYEGSYWNEENNNGLVIYFAEGAKYYFDDIKVENNGSTIIFDDFESAEQKKVFNWTTTGDSGGFEVVEEENGNHYYKISGDNRYFKIPVVMKGGSMNSTIRFKAKMSGFGEGKSPFVGYNMEDEFKIIDENYWTITEGEDGWKTYEHTFDRWTDGTLNFQFYLGWNGMSEMLIDDIYFKNNTKGKVLVNDDCESSEYYVYPNELVSLSANGLDNNIVLTWKNPDRSDITGFEIYEGTEKIDVSEEISTTARALNKVVIAPEDDEVHTYRVAMTAGGNVNYKSVSGKRTEFFMNPGETNDGYKLEHARLVNWNNGGTDPFGSARIDTMTKYSGNSSLCINANFYATVWDNNIRLQMGTKGLTTGKTYKLSYMTKYNKTNANINTWITNVYTHGINDNGGVGWVTGGSPKNIIGYYNDAANAYDTNWMKQEFVFTCGGDGEIYFVIGNGSDNVWIDDITLYEYDEATDTTSGDNKIFNGGFEYELDDCELNGNTITWSVPDGAGYSYINIYTVADGITSEPVKVAANAGTYTLPELKTSKEKIIVKAVRANGNLVNETECATFERARDFYIADVTYDSVTKNDDNTYTVAEAGIENVKSGYIRANVTMENNKLSKLEADVYTALYNGDRLVKVEKSEASILKGVKATTNTVIEVPADNGNYKIKTFVFDKDAIVPKTGAAVLLTAVAE